MESKTAIYSISSVAKLTGLSQRQIRYYETMSLISPVRSKGNQRLYSSEDIETLLTIKTLLKEGLTLQGIKAAIEGKSKTLSEESWEKEGEEMISPQDRQKILMEKLREGHPLNSLYPVNNQSTLFQLLLKHREVEEQAKEGKGRK